MGAKPDLGSAIPLWGLRNFLRLRPVAWPGQSAWLCVRPGKPCRPPKALSRIIHAELEGLTGRKVGRAVLCATQPRRRAEDCAPYLGCEISGL